MYVWVTEEDVNINNLAEGSLQHLVWHETYRKTERTLSIESFHGRITMFILGRQFLRITEVTLYINNFCIWNNNRYENTSIS
jgi:hypothetical protein